MADQSRMDADEPRARADALVLLTRQDLDPLSADELTARIATLRAEIARTEARLAFAASHRSSADSLFRS